MRLVHAFFGLLVLISILLLFLSQSGYTYNVQFGINTNGLLTSKLLNLNTSKAVEDIIFLENITLSSEDDVLFDDIWEEYLGRNSYDLSCSGFVANEKSTSLHYNSTGRIVVKREPKLSMNCNDIRRRVLRLYEKSELNNSFAIARNVYENYYLQEILLSQSYSPSNAYCYAFDNKSSKAFVDSMNKMASCLQNVIILDETFDFDSGGHFQNHAHLACMRTLLLSSKWKYVFLLQVNLTKCVYFMQILKNSDIFIKSPQEISQIIGILNGAPLFASKKPFKQRVPKMNITAKSMKLFLTESNRTEDQLNTAFMVRKSAVQMLLPRSFVLEMIRSLNLTKMLTAFNNGKQYGTDEYLFATLASAHFLDLPGQVENKCNVDVALRYVHWNFRAEEKCKSRKKRHGVCLLGVEYLSTLGDSPLIIVWPEFDFGALMCIDREFHGKNNSNRDWKKVTEFYTDIPHVREYSLKENGAFNATTFKC